MKRTLPPLALLCLALPVPAQISWLQIGPSPSPRRNHAMACDASTGRLVVFGGETQSTPSDETFEWNGTGWAQTFGSSPRPLGRTNAAMAYDASRNRLVLFGGYDGTSFRSETWECGGYAWLAAAPVTAPSARASHGMAYDAARQRTVLFGGHDGNSLLGDTWEWNGTTWTKRTPVTSPPPTLFPAMTYDSVRQRVLMFGAGFMGNDLWEWDGTDWLRRTPASSPPAQLGAAIAYDPSRNRTVLLGNGETWEWNGTTWLRLTVGTSPTSLSRHTMAYDTRARRIVAFGGASAIFPVALTAESWEFDGTTWTLRDAGTAAPQARRNHALTFAQNRGRAVLFGGNSNGSGASLNDTWEHDGSQWIQKFPSLAPGPRASAPLAFDSWRGNAVLFGGINSANQYYTDTWTWDGTNWTPTYAVGPTPRYAHAMAFDAVRGEVVLFGGSTGVGQPRGDTWTWNGTTWTLRSPANSPVARFGHAMAFEANRGKVLLHGGTGKDTNGNPVRLWDTWEWDGGDWTYRPALPAPGGTAIAAYDSARRTVIGYFASAVSGLTFEWDGANWEFRSTFFAPSSGGLDAMAYDTVNQRTILFGGGPASGNQTWVLGTSKPATFRIYGQGCAGTTGTPTLSAAGLPWVGTTLTLTLSGAQPSRPAVLLHGFSALYWSGLVLPYDLTTFGAPSCILYNSGDFAPALTTNALGSASVQLPVPLDASLAGLRFYDQFAAYDPAANAFGLVFTKGGAGVVGTH